MIVKVRPWPERARGHVAQTDDRIGAVDQIVVHTNADRFPNVSRVRVEHVAFARPRARTPFADPALVRVPEWDATCP